MTRSKRTLLLTGGSGVLGHALIDELVDEFDIVCLRNRRVIADTRIGGQFQGALDQPLLGLDRAAYGDLARRVDVIVHAAAVTNWKEDPQRIREINLAGPRAMLQLADEAQSPVYFVSTAFVANSLVGSEHHPGPASYIRSKIEAEQLVRDHGGSSVIVRPSIVSGSSVDGRMAAFQGLHRVLGGVVRGRVPVVPCEPDSLIDAIPQDVVARAIGDMLRSELTSGEFWLTAGPNALQASEFCNLCLDLAAKLGLPAEGPRFIAGEAVDRLLIPLLEDVLPPEAQQAFRDYLELLWMFQTPEPLPTSLPDMGMGVEVSHEALTAATAKSLTYWARTKGFDLPTSEHVA